MKKRSVELKSIPSGFLDLDKIRDRCAQSPKPDAEACGRCLISLQEDLAKAEESDRLDVQLEVLRLLSNCCFNNQNLVLATKYLNKVIAVTDKGVPLPTLNLVYNSLGRINLMQCNYPEATRNFLTGLELSEAAGKFDQAAGICMNLSTVYGYQGKPEISREYINRAIDIYGQLGDQKMLRVVKCTLANILHQAGEFDQALNLKLECIDYFAETGDSFQHGKEMNSVAAIYYDMGNLEKAIEYSLEAIRIKEKHGDEASIAASWVNLGVFYRELGKADTALSYYQKALAYYEKVGNKKSIALCLNNIGNFYLDRDNYSEALKYLQPALAMKKEIGDIHGMIVILENIAIICDTHLKHPSEALDYLQQAVQNCLQTKDVFTKCRLNLRVAQILAQLQRSNEALALLQQTEEQINSLGYEKLFPEIANVTACIYSQKSDFEKAYQFMQQYGKMIDTLHKNESLAKIAEMQTKYETEKKEKEAEIYRLKNIELEDKNRQIEEQRNKLQEALDKLDNSEIRYNFVSEELSKSIGSTLIGKSNTIRNITQMIALVAKSDKTNVLITGETGTGKEIIARNIHACSKRGKQHFYAVNCSAVPENLFESQFFGHEKDAFTGAGSTKIGWFEIANNSTLFLDEIGSLSFDQQAKLLRSLEEHCIVRVGSHREIPVDVRIISATNVNLLDKVSTEEFRRDLYHRLAIFVINIPPLRDRKDEIPLLVKHFVGISSLALNKRIIKVEKNVISRLMEYDFPGNVRELKNMVERAVLVSDSSTLRTEHFLIPALNPQQPQNQEIIPLELLERDMIIKALQTTGFNRVQAAKLLKVDRKVVERKIQKYKIDIPII